MNQEILKVYVKITYIDIVEQGTENIHMVHFTGSATGKEFQGEILPGGVDVQYTKDGVTQFSARYMISGEDMQGNPCKVYIDNVAVAAKEGETKTQATVMTDSKALEDWTTKPLTGYIRGPETGDEDVVIWFYK